MSKLSLTNLVNLSNETAAVTAINNNNAAIITAMDNTLSRDGTLPNTMTATLDMNSHPIINLPTPLTNYEPLRVIDRTTLNGGGTITISPLPTGGTSGQYLAKNSGTNFDVGWYTPVSGSTSSTFDTLALAQAGILPLSVINITIVRKQSGWPLANAPYVRGTISGPNAFQDALGNYWQVDTSYPTLKAVWFWAGGGGDDTTPLNTACAVSSGKTLDLGSLAYNISGPVSVLNHFVLRGDSYKTCSITVLGANDVKGMIQGFNKGWVTIEGISFIGNNIAGFSQQAGAIHFGMDSNNIGDVGPVSVQKCYFSNFKQNFWVRFINGGGINQLGTVTISDNVFSSVDGNSRTYNDPNDISYMIQVWGNAVTLSSSIDGVIIQRNKAYARGVGGFLQLWQNTGNFLITDNDVQEAGYNISALINVYVFLIYTGTFDAFMIKGGVFANNRSTNTVWGGGYFGCGAGLYAATVGPMTITGNYITGITRSDSGTLRRAGISVNGVGRTCIHSNTFDGCNYSIALSGPADQLIFNNFSLHHISNNVMASGVGGSNGVHVSWFDVGTSAPYVAVENNLISVGGAQVVSAPGTFGTIFVTGTKP